MRCEICNSIGKTDMHHKNGDNKNNSVENILVVCRRCHKKIHATTKIIRTGISSMKASERVKRKLTKLKHFKKETYEQVIWRLLK